MNSFVKKPQQGCSVERPGVHTNTYHKVKFKCLARQVYDQDQAWLPPF